MTETKPCEWCSQPYERETKVTRAKWALRRCCGAPLIRERVNPSRGLPMSGSLRSTRAPRNGAEKCRGVVRLVPMGHRIVFPTSADPGDGGFIKLRRDATHVHYEASASWGAI